MTVPRSSIPVFLFILLAGCEAPVDLESTISTEAQEAALPEIVPMEPLLQAPEKRLTPEDAEQLIARGRAADARAARLR